MPAGRAEEGLKIREVHGGVLLGRGHEDRPVAHLGQAEVALVVAEAVEEEEVELSRARGHRLDQSGRVRPVLRTQASSSSRVWGS